jgi:asparagine synthase (glutamine-hydrolysing)
VRSFSVDFVGMSDNFQPDVDRDLPDAPFARELAGYVKAEHRTIVLDNAMMTDPLYRLGVLTANDKPVRLTDLQVSLYLLFRAIRRHSTVALSGESADELFGGYRWFHDGTAEKARTFPWLASLPPRPDGTEGNNELIHPDLVGVLDIDGYRDAHYQRALAEVGHLPGEDPHERGMREVNYLALTRFLQVLLDRKDRMSMAYGLEVRVPFCDHRLVEYVYNTPWSMKTFDRREKSLLRAAVADLLPASIVRRNKSPYPSPQDPRYERALRARLARLLEAPGRIATVLNPSRLRELVDEPLDSNGFGPHRRAVESVLSIDDWLNRYPVHLAL